MRYPAALLPEVHVQLQAAQLQRHANLVQAQRDAMSAGRAAALGGGRAPATGLQEAPTPVDQASLAKAMRAKPSIRDFFKPVAKKGAGAGEESVRAAPHKAQAANGSIHGFLVGAKRAREVDGEQLSTLKAMGFEEDVARRALQQEDNLDRALARLLAHD